jgi:double-stranded uracil-DNA glycosylase
LLAPWEERELLARGYGITNIVGRATGSAAELGADELRAGRRRLERKCRRFAPRWVAVLGIGAYREAFERRRARVGPQEETIGGARVWVLPNPSGLNANHQLPELVRLFRVLRKAIAGDQPSPMRLPVTAS